MILNTLLASIPAKPPEFPDLPTGYIEWQYYNEHGISMYELFPKDSAEHYRFRYKPVDNPTFLPFSLRIPDLDSTCGKYYRDSTVGYVIFREYTRSPGNPYIKITWGPHQNNEQIKKKAKFIRPACLSFQNTDWNKIYIDTLVGIRIRCWKWKIGCDGAYHMVSSFTNYYIPTSKYDYFITCYNTFYIYEKEPDPCDLPPEECDSIDKSIYGDEGWKPIQHYPDRITELERAVEQTFRVK